jgi:JmjC domain, hydroxylase
MCYAGIGDTFTPAHKDLCASSGHNLMCHTEMNGSSYWFMTKSSDAARASDFFQKLGQELDHEAHVISLKELAKAPFTVYVAEQVLGDLVLVPPRSCHQVVNFGGITLKTSWSRMSLEGLITAYYHELPIYQRCVRKTLDQCICSLVIQGLQAGDLPYQEHNLLCTSRSNQGS